MDTTPADLYAVLGLTPRATQAQLRHAYRALVRQHHPDTRTVDHAQAAFSADIALRNVLSAYQVLADPARRADYDRRRDATSRPSTGPNIRIHPTHPAPTNDAPIRAGPVHWHRQP